MGASRLVRRCCGTSNISFAKQFLFAEMFFRGVIAGLLSLRADAQEYAWKFFERTVSYQLSYCKSDSIDRLDREPVNFNRQYRMKRTRALAVTFQDRCVLMASDIWARA